MSKSLPALMRSEKVQGRAKKGGFDYPDVDMAFSDLKSEVDELDVALKGNDEDNLEEELGDVIFAAVNVARMKGKNPEEMLTKSCNKFISRFEKVENLAYERDIDMKSVDLQVLIELWNEAKK